MSKKNNNTAGCNHLSVARWPIGGKVWSYRLLQAVVRALARLAPSVSRSTRLLAALLVLSACGGGGGSSSGATESGRESGGFGSVNPPSLAPLDLDETNAIEAATIAISAIEQAGTAAEMALFLVDSQSGRASSECAGIDFSEPRIALDKDGNRSLSAGDEFGAAYATCQGSSGAVFVALTEVDPNATTFTGDVEFVATHSGGATTEGAFTLVSALGTTRAGRNQTLSEITLTYTFDDVVDHVTDGVLTRTYGVNAGSSTLDLAYNFHLAGHITSNKLGGEYDFETRAPFTGMLRDAPRDGELVLTSSTSSVRFVPTSDAVYLAEVADLEIATGASGQYVVATQVTWARLTTGLLFSWDANTRPRITALAIEPRNPTAADELTAIFATEDLDGDTVSESISWKRNGAVLVEYGHSPVLPTGNYKKGDLIELRIRATDQATLSEAEVSVTIGNIPPETVGATIHPSAPGTADDLTLSWSASDADGDALGATFEWHRNGVAIPGQNGSVLASSHFVKGDNVTGIAWVTDGEDTVRVETAVDILDSPAIVSLQSISEAAAPGEAITAIAAATDPDGDDVSPHQFMLTHGPAGMTVDPQTGVVTWIAGGPMFEQTMVFDFGVTVDEAGAGVAFGTITVNDPGRELPFMRMDFEFLGRASVADLDADGRDEALVLGDHAIYELEADPAGTDYHQPWAYLFIDRGVDAATSGDIDGDGVHEIFLAAGKGIARLDGIHRRKSAPGEVDAMAADSCRNLEFGDLNNDGASELVCIGHFVTTIMDAESLEIVAEVFPSSTSSVLGNVDGDAALEIVTADGYVYDGVALLAQSLTPQWLYPERFGAGVTIGDIDADGIGEIITDGSGQLRIFDARTQTLRTTVDAPAADVLHVADMTGDGADELVVGYGRFDTFDQGQLRIYKYNPSTETFDLQSSFDSPATSTPRIAAADFHGDGSAELLWGTATTAPLMIASLGPTFQIEWPLGALAQPLGTTGHYIGGELISDLVNPPAALFVWRSGQGGRLVSMDPNTGHLEHRETPSAVSYWGATAVVADYDNDGSDEALIVTADSIEVYDYWADAIERTLPNSHYAAEIVHGDLNADSADDLVMLSSHDAVLRAYDLLNGILLWELPLPATGNNLALADVDGDAALEIIVAANEQIIVFNQAAEGEYVQSAISPPFDHYLDLETLDADFDGRAEIYVASYADSRFATRVTRLDGNLQRLGAFDLDWLASSMVAEQSRSGSRNLVMIDDELVAVDAMTGMPVWRSPPFSGDVQRNGVRFVDVANDGNLRLTVRTSEGFLVTR